MTQAERELLLKLAELTKNLLPFTFRYDNMTFTKTEVTEEIDKLCAAIISEGMESKR